MLMANATNEIGLVLRTHDVGVKNMYINVVDVEFCQLIRTILVVARTDSPTVTKVGITNFSI